MATHRSSPNSARSAAEALFYFVPFAVLNAIVANRIEPFFSLIRPGPHTSPQEYVLLALALLLLPAGAYHALRRREFRPANLAAAAVLLIVFIGISIGLGSDIYRCDILQVPNCD